MALCLNPAQTSETRLAWDHWNALKKWPKYQTTFEGDQREDEGTLMLKLHAHKQGWTGEGTDLGCTWRVMTQQLVACLYKMLSKDIGTFWNIKAYHCIECLPNDLTDKMCLQLHVTMWIWIHRLWYLHPSPPPLNPDCLNRAHRILIRTKAFILVTTEITSIKVYCTILMYALLIVCTTYHHICSFMRYEICSYEYEVWNLQA